MKFNVYGGFLCLLKAIYERDVRMQMCSSLADNDIYMEDHSEAEQTCRFCLKKRTERVKYQINHVWNNKRDVKFPLFHACLLAGKAFCLKTFTKQTN